MTAADYQLDLFGGLPPALQRKRDVLVCLRDAMYDALEIVVELTYTRPRDTRSTRYDRGWAFRVAEAGLRFEPSAGWFDRAPEHLVSWQELAGLIGDDPRRAEVAAWVRSLPLPRWQLLMRPHELWSDPGGWHVSYFCHDHVHAQWPARRRAWQLVLDLLNDAIARVETAGSE